MEFGQEGKDLAAPYEVLLHAAMEGDSARFTRQDSVEETWRILQPLLDEPPRVHEYENGSWGPDAANKLVSHYGGWHGPVDAVSPKAVPAPGRRAPRRRRRSRRSPTTRSCPTATRARWWRPTARSTGCASRASTRRACSAPCSTARPARSGWGRSASTTLRPSSYEPGTNTLLTTWKTPSGWILVRDALTMGPTPRRGHRSPRTRGPPPTTTATTCSCARSFASTATSRWSSSASPSSTTAACRRSGRSSATTGTRPTRAAPVRRSGCRPTWRSGSRATACGPGTCSSRATRSTARSRGPRGSRRRRTSTRRTRGSPRRRGSGGRWLGRARMPDHRWRDPIQRSALAIKGLTYMPTGATVAALTTSLPETPGGERNWDYRFTWMRDATFTLQALHFLNLDWEADEFMQFVADLEPNDDGALQIMYGIDGRRDLTESTRDDLSGYAGARPGADRQRRLRPAPERRVRRGARLDPAPHPPQRAPAAAAVADRGDPGEVRDGRLARARPGDLGGARQAAALRVLEAHVLGRDGPRGQARRTTAATPSSRPRGRRPRRRSRRTSSSTA